jgi:two-component system, NtrC family, sensor kinase
MQLQLIQAEKLAAVGQLTAGIVHDVKNPLAVIKGLSELMLGNDLTPEEHQNLNVIHESSVKANAIVTDLLKFARQSTPEKKFQDLRETVEASLRLTAYLSRKANIEVIKDLPDHPVLMWYDSQQLEQVFINIIHNAIQAMEERGILRVSMVRSDVGYNENTAVVAFQDSGVGIPPENLSRIFDPFFTTKPEGQGTGLGLSVSYGIISNHNGHIQVESNEGKGSTFTIILPIDLTPPQGVG